MKIAYLSHPSACIAQGRALEDKLNKIKGLTVLNPFDLSPHVPDLVALEFEMIDSADYLLVYLPEKVFTFGVPIEVHYAYIRTKRIFILTTEDILKYPFVQAFISKFNQYTDEESFLYKVGLLE